MRLLSRWRDRHTRLDLTPARELEEARRAAQQQNAEVRELARVHAFERAENHFGERIAATFAASNRRSQ